MTHIFSLLSFLLPFQLSLHLNKLASTVYGFKIDYLTPAIFITDIIIAWLVVTWLIQSRHKIHTNFKTKYLILAVGLCSFIVVNVLNSLYIFPAIYKWLKIVEFTLLVFYIKSDKSIKIYNHFLKPLSYSVLMVSILAILQFINKGSLGGVFYFFGERSLRFSDPGISQYPYSTFSHPNSLSGFLFVSMLAMFGYKNYFNKIHFYVISALSILTIFLTNSLNVYLAFLIFLVVIKLDLKKLIIPFVILLSLLIMINPKVDLMNASLIDRQKLAKASMEMFARSPLFGVGINNFIPGLVQNRITFENSWQFQPVHNIYLLILAELGAIGFMLFVYLLLLIPNFYFLIPILLTGMFDHYWLTLQQNMLLFAMLIGFSFGKICTWKKE